LRNERMDIATLRQHLPAACWLALRTCCEQAMGRVFPNSLYAGLDVLVGSNIQHHAIPEVNAFGDHLNDTLWNGLTTHQSEILAALAATITPESTTTSAHATTAAKSALVETMRARTDD